MRNHHDPHPHHQRGAALATALLFLVILTLLGLAAMRSGSIDLRLAQNEGTRLDAQQNAQTALESVRAYSAALNVLPGSGYLQSCAIGSSLNASSLATQQGFSCPSASVTAALMPNTNYKNYLYVSVRREQINGNDYAPVAALREGDSGDRYNLAAFTIVGGYDRVASDDTLAQGGAEVVQGVYVKVAKIRGLSQQ
ncbi:MAG: PilX N-terminal [Hydrocarboniphaga sp.]|uniref:PilX N-terminal domain-containing pilus assembly protein n=1 Tax=Hydrocarboniphaga sp. TaxID=2033016 RepID=UPI00260F4030|nr:PilX N-terminal domain-containing pilus assembly protein [Hydrocarboniphaga sp.]MDB5968806.1 PilX N-terminal [Hydrocarboniphaga sp.]